MKEFIEEKTGQVVQDVIYIEEAVDFYYYLVVTESHVHVVKEDDFDSTWKVILVSHKL